MREGRCGIAGPVRLWKFQRSMVVGGTWPKSAVGAKNAFFECCEPPSALRTRPTGCPGETRHGGVRGRTGNVRLTAYVYGLARETSYTGGTRAALKSRVDTTAFMESPDEGRWFNISRDLARSRLNLSRADLVSRYLARSRPFRACSLRELPVTFR